MLMVNICIIPFSIPSHRGQIFYHAEAFFAQCCLGLDKKAFMATLTRAAQKVYDNYMRYHAWNFEAAGLWQQIQVPNTIMQKGLTCLENSALILSHLIGCSEPIRRAEEYTRQIMSNIDTCYYSEQDSFSDEMPVWSSETPFADKLSKRPERHAGNFDPNDTQIRNRETNSVARVTEEFLEGFRRAGFSGINAELYGRLSNLDAPKSRYTEPATQAFSCCALMVVQAKEHLKHANFTRFISLCFFLVWQSFACEPGKAGARVINAKMREAGFEGTSRSLKTLRDETAFINRLVASVESQHGIGIASLVFYHIFDSSNYHLIRLINRHSTSTKGLAIASICKRIYTIELEGISLPILRIHELISEHMPNLDKKDISRAIGYSEIHPIVTTEEDLLFTPY